MIARLAVPAFQPEGKGKLLKLAALSLATRHWTIIEPAGDGMIPPPRWGNFSVCFDPSHGVFLIQARHSDRVWVYRH